MGITEFDAVKKLHGIANKAQTTATKIRQGGNMEPKYEYHEVWLEIEDYEIPLRLKLEWCKASPVAKDHISRPIEPPEADGYIIIGAEWKRIWDMHPDWESVPDLIWDIIKKNELEMLERAGLREFA